MSPLSKAAQGSISTNVRSRSGALAISGAAVSTFTRRPLRRSPAGRLPFPSVTLAPSHVDHTRSVAYREATAPTLLLWLLLRWLLGCRLPVEHSRQGGRWSRPISWFC